MKQISNYCKILVLVLTTISLNAGALVTSKFMLNPTHIAEEQHKYAQEVKMSSIIKYSAISLAVAFVSYKFLYPLIAQTDIPESVLRETVENKLNTLNPEQYQDLNNHLITLAERKSSFFMRWGHRIGNMALDKFCTSLAGIPVMMFFNSAFGNKLFGQRSLEWFIQTHVKSFNQNVEYLTHCALQLEHATSDMNKTALADQLSAATNLLLHNVEMMLGYAMYTYQSQLQHQQPAIKTFAQTLITSITTLTNKLGDALDATLHNKPVTTKLTLVIDDYKNKMNQHIKSFSALE